MKINHPRLVLFLLLLLILLVGLFPWTRAEYRALLMGLILQLVGFLFLKYRKELTDQSLSGVKEDRERWEKNINQMLLGAGIFGVGIGIFLFIASLLEIISE